MTEHASRGASDRAPDRTAPPGRQPATTDLAPESTLGAPMIGPASTLLALQRLVGNRAVGSFVERRTLQRPAGRSPETAAASVGRPGIQRAMSGEMADQIAHRLSKAMRGWGTDEEAIYGALSGRSKDDLDLITAKFKPLAQHGTLDADLRDE